MNYLAIYYGYQTWSRRNIEKGFIFKSLDELENWLHTVHTYCDSSRPTIELNDASREKVVNWMKSPESTVYFKTIGCGAWEIALKTTDCKTFEEYKQRRDDAETAAAHEREQKRLAQLHEQRRGWYRVTLELSGDGVLSVSHGKEFTGDVVAESGADAYNKAVNKCAEIAPTFLPAEMTGYGYSFEFLGVKTDYGYSVELWELWKEEGKI